MSQSFEPIRITEDGDLLEEYPQTPHPVDDQELGSCPGIHRHCEGWIDRHHATDHYDTLVCRRCYLRVIIPREAKTYGDLRLYFTKKFAQT